MLTSVLIRLLGLGMGEIIIILFIFLLLLIPFVLFLLTLQKTLEKISPENRKIEPSQVWLLFIPLFNFGWQFVIVNKVAESLRNELLQKNISLSEENPAQAIGIAMCICNCCTVIPVLNFISSIGGMVCWIIYWVNISKYKSSL